MKTFEVDGPLNVSVECPEGDVRVATTDGHRAQVDVQPLRDDDASREAAAGTTVELRGNDLAIEVPKRSWGLFGRGPRVRIDVRVPHDSGLSFKTASADVNATGRYGDVRGKTASGDVVVTEAGSVRVESASGDLRVDEVRGEAGLKTASGNVRVGHAGGPLDASVVSGDLRIQAADGDASLHAVSGDIDLAAVARGDVEVRSVSGDVTVGVRQGSRVHVDVTTVSGDLKSDLDLNDAPAGGDGPMVEIKGRTVSGDLRVRRA
jgi:DUF4097 and DUF4098 domain-containing protein YvlB